MGDFKDDSLFLSAGLNLLSRRVTIAMGDYGWYSVIRDWHLGVIERRDLRPAAAEGRTGAGK
jgi:hypothetical protein